MRRHAHQEDEQGGQGRQRWECVELVSNHQVASMTVLQLREKTETHTATVEISSDSPWIIPTLLLLLHSRNTRSVNARSYLCPSVHSNPEKCLNALSAKLIEPALMARWVSCTTLEAVT